MNFKTWVEARRNISRPKKYKPFEFGSSPSGKIAKAMAYDIVAAGVDVEPAIKEIHLDLYKIINGPYATDALKVVSPYSKLALQLIRQDIKDFEALQKKPIDSEIGWIAYSAKEIWGELYSWYSFLRQTNDEVLKPSKHHSLDAPWNV